MKEMKWNTFEIQTFLTIYENYPLLWNVRLNDYKNVSVKESTFNHFTEELRAEGLMGDMTNKQLKAKIKSIRDSYRQELAKIAKSVNGGAESCDVYKPKLIWFEKANFLREVMSTKSKLNQEIIDTCDEETEDSDGAKIHPIVSPNKMYCFVESLSDKMRPPLKKQKHTSKRQKTTPSEINSALHSFQEMMNNKEDVYDLFGKYIASELRALPSREAILLQQDVQSSITKVKLSLCQPSTNNIYDLPLSVEMLSPSHFQSSSRRSSSSTENSYGEVKIVSIDSRDGSACDDITCDRVLKTIDHERCNGNS